MTHGGLKHGVVTCVLGKKRRNVLPGLSHRVNRSVWKGSWNSPHTEVESRHHCRRWSPFLTASRSLWAWISRKMKGSSQHPIWLLTPSLSRAWRQTLTCGTLCSPTRPASGDAGSKLDGLWAFALNANPAPPLPSNVAFTQPRLETWNF